MTCEKLGVGLVIKFYDMKKLICPFCKNEDHLKFGFPPCCAGENGIHATCYNCNKIFVIPKAKIK